MARRAGLVCEAFATADKYELIYARSPALEATGGIYLAAGIHGDEPASTEGLYLWAELNLKYLRQLPLFLLPCLNPWGLINNRRVDSEGRDLNRSYHLDDVPVIKAHKDLLKGLSFSVAICLHEDYDAQGVYLYEVRNRGTRTSHRARIADRSRLLRAGRSSEKDRRQKGQPRLNQTPHPPSTIPGYAGGGLSRLQS